MSLNGSTASIGGTQVSDDDEELEIELTEEEYNYAV